MRYPWWIWDLVGVFYCVLGAAVAITCQTRSVEFEVFGFQPLLMNGMGIALFALTRIGRNTEKG